MAGAVTRARLPGVALCLLLSAACAPAPAAAKQRVGLEVAPRSGRIELRGPGGVSLVESDRATDGPGGRVGFRTAAGWHHATRLIERSGGARRPRLVLATDDPAGRRIRLSARVGGSVVDLRARVIGGPTGDVEATGIGFAAGPGERYLGFGERSNAVDQRGRVVESYVGEGPYQPGEYAVPAATLPPWAFHEREDATYFPMPWLVSTRGYGALVKNYETSYFRLASEAADEWSAEAESPRLGLAFFGGPDPADVVARLTRRTGRQPEPAAPWQLGPWFQSGHDNFEPDEMSYVEILRAADAPISAMETHRHYMPCGVDQGHEAQERARAEAIHAAGLAAVTYTREALCSSYASAFDRALAAGAFLEHPDGRPYLFRAFAGGGVTEIGMLDFSSPAAQPVYTSILDRPYGNGFDGWMEDYGEYVPPDSVAANGMIGAQMPNYYPVVYHRAGTRYANSKKRPLVRFVRSGWTGVHPYAPIVWGGDPTTGWGFDGLRSALTEALTMGLSGISSWGSDIGGFFTFSEQRLDEELLARWIELGSVSGVMRTKAEGIGVVSKADRPQIWEQPTLEVWRRYAKLRTQLYPFLVAADRAYRRTGMPLMRHLALAYPRDPRATAREDELLLAGRLLVAPVLEPGATERELYLPRGRWVDFWRALEYREGSGALRLDRARVLRGGRDLTLPAPLAELPMLAKAGTLLALLPADVDTLARYGRRAPGVVRLRDRRHRLHLIALPRGDSHARFYERGRLRSREGAGFGPAERGHRAGGRAWRLRIDSPRDLRVTLEASMRTLRHPFGPRSVTLDGRELESWRYDRGTGVLHAELRARRGESELVVRA
ncbi:MAG: hypothetical protein GEU88_02940 [Solirubrobacterales bacterium]|nr:hypothetical protein [Solirubrobacterales bacterium]